MRPSKTPQKTARISGRFSGRFRQAAAPLQAARMQASSAKGPPLCPAFGVLPRDLLWGEPEKAVKKILRKGLILKKTRPGRLVFDPRALHFQVNSSQSAGLTGRKARLESKPGGNAGMPHEGSSPQAAHGGIPGRNAGISGAGEGMFQKNAPRKAKPAPARIRDG